MLEYIDYLFVFQEMFPHPLYFSEWFNRFPQLENANLVFMFIVGRQSHIAKISLENLEIQIWTKFSEVISAWLEMPHEIHAWFFVFLLWVVQFWEEDIDQFV